MKFIFFIQKTIAEWIHLFLKDLKVLDLTFKGINHFLLSNAFYLPDTYKAKDKLDT